MSSVAVFVFLLDNLAGFNIALNETLRLTNESHASTLQACEPKITDQILSTVSQNLDLDIKPYFTKNTRTHQLDNELFKDESSENFLAAIVDNSLHDGENKTADSSVSHFDLFDEYDSYKQKNVINIKNETVPTFPKRAPFMVAIFETLSNVTAQTCAGTLISPRWVLTAANCVNILSNLYANSTKQKFATQYTIVEGSTNPLLDGSAHNVTKVLLYPEKTSGRTIDLNGPYLALMRVEPEVEGPTVDLLQEKVEGGDVMVYGWLLSKNDSGNDSLNLTSLSSTILSSKECRSIYRYKNNDVICLFNNDIDKNITQLSSGGPVLMIRNSTVKMVAVLQTDEHLFVAYPLAERISWIKQIIISDK